MVAGARAAPTLDGVMAIKVGKTAAIPSPTTSNPRLPMITTGDDQNNSVPVSSTPRLPARRVLAATRGAATAARTLPPASPAQNPATQRLAIPGSTPRSPSRLDDHCPAATSAPT